MESSTVVIESQPDWLTIATHTTKHTEQLRNIVEGLDIAELQAGNRSIPFRTGGYVGWRTGRVAWGERESAGLLQLSGDLAATEWDRVYPLRDSLTRLDVAVTVRLSGTCDGLPETYYQQAAAYHRAHTKSALPVLVCDANGGGTCMVGARGSDFHLRFYNKQAECESRGDQDGAEHYQNCMRAELECTDLAAQAVAKQVNDTADRPHWIQSFVHDYLTAHGIMPPFRPPARWRSSRDSADGVTTRRVGSGCNGPSGRRWIGCSRMVDCKTCLRIWG